MNDINKYKDLNELFWTIGCLNECKSVIKGNLKGYDDFCKRLEYQAERAEIAYKNLKQIIDKQHN